MRVSKHKPNFHYWVNCFLKRLFHSALWWSWIVRVGWKHPVADLRDRRQRDGRQKSRGSLIGPCSRRPRGQTVWKPNWQPKKEAIWDFKGRNQAIRPFGEKARLVPRGVMRCRFNDGGRFPLYSRRAGGNWAEIGTINGALNMHVLRAGRHHLLKAHCHQNGFLSEK